MDRFELAAGPSREDAERLERNLAALARLNPHLVARLRAATPRTDVEFVETPEGVPGLVLGAAPGATGRAVGPGSGSGSGSGFALDLAGLAGPSEPPARVTLASRRRPLTEGERLASKVDVRESAAVAAMGFGAGYHLRALAERVLRTGLIICFEPDVSLLRAIFERVDHSLWIQKSNLVILTDPNDETAISRAIAGSEAVVSLGVKILAHPPSEARIAESEPEFTKRLVNVLAAVRTSIATTLVHAESTLRNSLMNAGDYVLRPGIGDLLGALEGRPAIIVSAGPSLARTMEALARPGVRERFCIIAVQTVLRPLLARGIRPHFVCALDHHEISRRFYEGLTAEDVEGVTLVVEPKASAAILEAFPGRVRVIAEPLLEKAAGPLAPDHAAIKPGSTVSHLCHYFARALRADPVIHTGLDLGFTDGQYYSAGAAIHDVWAPELNEFRSLEMFEWERIARGKATLHSKTDHLDRRIYTDDQMNSYLARFESDFAEDEAAGRTVIDATEGGVKKRHTSVLTLADALELYDPGSPLELPETPPGVADADGRAAAMREQLDRVAAQAVDVRTICNRTVEKLRQMLEHFEDRDRVDSLITGVHELRDEVETLQPAYGLIQFVNQTGTLNRFRRDRAIALEPEGSDELETQRQRIERDIENVEWLADAAGTVSSLVRRAAGVLGGSGPRETRDRLERAPTPGRDDSTVPGIAAVVFVDPDIGGLGLRRDLGDEIALGQNALRLTLRRLRLARRPGRIVLATGDPGRVRELAGDALDADPRIEIAEIDRQTLRDRLRAVGSARQWSLDSWRGALGNLAAADEGCDLRLLEQLTGRLGLDAALLVSPDAVLLDPALIDEVVTRYAEAVDAHRLAFVPAPAGLGAVLLRRTTIESLAAGDRAVNPFASIGALLSYIPVNPQADPLGKGFCVQIPTAVRDIGRRLLADTRAGRELAARLIGRLGDRYDDLDAAQLAALCDQAPPDRLAGPVHLVIEPCTGRLSCGLWSSRLREALNPGHLDRGPIDAALVGSIARQAVGLRAETTITFHGAGDPLMHPHAAELVDAVKLEGVGAAHLRTDLLRPGIQIEDLVDGGADVVSVDALAIDPLSFVTMHGHDRYDEIESTLEALAAAANRTGFGGLPCPWIVPRITRSDESFEQIEGFFDAWIMAAGAAMIDPLPGTVEHARIAPLPTNRVGRRRTEETTLFIDASGVAHHAGEELGSLRTEPLAAIWRRALRGAGPEIVTRGRPVAGVA